WAQLTNNYLLVESHLVFTKLRLPLSCERMHVDLLDKDYCRQMSTLRNKLTDIKCRTTGVGTHGDGGGLYLLVQQGAHGLRRNWLLRFMIAGRARGMGLGSYPDISLQRAREKAQECRSLKADGIDPIERKRAVRAYLSRSEAEQPPPSFDECADAYVASHRASWRSPKHGHDWLKS